MILCFLSWLYRSMIFRTQCDLFECMVHAIAEFCRELFLACCPMLTFLNLTFVAMLFNSCISDRCSQIWNVQFVAWSIVRLISLFPFYYAHKHSPYYWQITW
jgi:hypothetical protein